MTAEYRHSVFCEFLETGCCTCSTEYRTSELQDMKLRSRGSSAPDTIDAIEGIRSRNNELWVSVLRIAFESDPARTKALLRRIGECDTAINRLLQKLIDQ